MLLKRRGQLSRGVQTTLATPPYPRITDRTHTPAHSDLHGRIAARRQ